MLINPFLSSIITSNLSSLPTPTLSKPEINKINQNIKQMKKKKQTHTRQQLLKQVNMAMVDTTKEKTKTNAYWDLKTQKSPILLPVIFHTSQVCSSNHKYNHFYFTHVQLLCHKYEISNKYNHSYLHPALPQISNIH